jgi:hypothetical protein
LAREFDNKERRDLLKRVQINISRVFMIGVIRGN